MRRGLTVKWWDGDDDECEVWVERTDRNELQIRIGRGANVQTFDMYLALDETEQLEDLLRAARIERWK